MLDLELVITIYSEEAQAAADRAQAAIVREQNQIIGVFGAGLEALSRGDLTFKLDSNIAPAYAALRASYMETQERLGDIVGQITSSSNMSVIKINGTAEAIF